MDKQNELAALDEQIRHVNWHATEARARMQEAQEQVTGFTNQRMALEQYRAGLAARLERKNDTKPE